MYYSGKNASPRSRQRGLLLCRLHAHCSVPGGLASLNCNLFFQVIQLLQMQGSSL
jgi:hypothetical protein